LGGGVYDVRDAFLRWVAQRRGIEVASMVADRRTEDMIFAEARAGTSNGASAHVDTAELEEVAP
jgi:hypothetical protein